MKSSSCKLTRRECNINWMLACPDPTPIAFFRYTFPAHKTKASDNYQKSLDLALNTANNQEIKDKLKIMKETVDDEKILRDWESWMQEKTAILVRRDVHSTNLNLHKEINTLSLNKDESLAKNTNLDGIDDDDSYNNFIEHGEENQLTTHRSWVLKSGTNVGDELAKYVKTIPEAHKCLNFKKEVKLVESDIPDVVEYFFDEVEKVSKKNDEYIINAIDDLTPEMIEKNRKVKFSDEDKEIFNGLRRAVITYAENLKDLEVPISEADFDNSFPNIGEIACWASARRRNKGRSIVLQARIGQKCNFRGTLKNSINNLEAIIGLRSGGLPVAHRKKIHEDRVDLSVAMRDVLYNFFKTNPNASGNELHSTYVLGIQSWGWIHETYGMDCKATNVLRLGRLSQKKMPNTLKTLAILEGLYATMSDIKSTLKIICDHTNGVSLSDSRLHRERKRKIPVYSEQSGLFGTPSSSPIKKVKRHAIIVIKMQHLIDYSTSHNFYLSFPIFYHSAENLKDLEVPISEADFDNSFPNIGEIACWASARRRNKGRSIVLQARIGQKCNFRGTLKNSINNLEAIIGLRSGGLPVAHRKKIHEDRVDLSVAMRDVLYNFFKTNPNASGNELHSTYVLGIQSWGWIHETYGMDCKATNVLRLGRLSQKKMPNTLKTLAILEGLYATMSDIKSTLKIICDHTNGVSLSDSRLHRERKRKIPVYSEQSGLFGTPSSSPIKKERTTKLSQTENAELKNEIAKLKRAVKNIEKQNLPASQDQDLSLVNQDASTGSEKTITSLSLCDAKTVTKCHDLNNSDTTSEILESDNQIVEGLIQEMTYDQAENI
ncbi:20541_t:CDS:10, partial [Entrophospora sp. SA101]